MQSLQPTSALYEFPQLSRLQFFSPQTQDFVANYLAHLRARHYAPSVQEATIRALRLSDSNRAKMVVKQI